MEVLPDFYHLTSLQIGDMQSYLSRVFLCFAPASDKLLILVDNRPWLEKKHQTSTQIWKLMVTKYRMSPFKNSRMLNESSTSGPETDSIVKSTDDNKPEKLYRWWFSLIDAAKWQEKSLFHVLDLCKDLHGFIVFEVAWKDVRGINYLNELQTDTSIALEVKSLKKWDFIGIDQAMSCLSSWFSATTSETKSLHDHLKQMSDMDAHVDCQRDLSIVSNDQDKVVQENIVYSVQEHPNETNKDVSNKQATEEDSSSKDKFDADCCTEDYFGPSKELDHDTASMPGHCVQMISSKCVDKREESSIDSTQYMDKLLLFRFSDGVLPFKLRQIITSNLRLLTLLESGLPSWVIFLQSYPIFCQFYRPWMRPLARTLYAVISLVTVIIGFYDLYKNVPLLKATASRLCGPLFDWIEAWGMISRLRYLGTMLFLQNFEKAIKWFLMMMRVVRPLVSVLMKPLMVPLLEIVHFISPVWSMFAETAELYFSTTWTLMKSSYDIISDLVDVLFSPFELAYSYILAIVMSVYPIFSSIWELFLIPFRLSLTLASYMASLFTNVYYLLKNVGWHASSITSLTSFSGVKSGANEISIWRTLWKDLFSQVFRATRSIINGFVAFATACNRHRLSIYNHIRVFLWHLSRLFQRGPHYSCPCQQIQRTENRHMVAWEECDRCK